MSKIEVALVDEHFMHGKVALNWCSACDSNLIIVVNDELINDRTQQGLLEMSVPDEIISRYYSIDKAVEKFKADKNGKSAIIITKNLIDLLKLTDSGVEVPKIILSSVPHQPGRVIVYPGVNLLSEQIEKLKILQSNGVELRAGNLSEGDPALLDLSRF